MNASELLVLDQVDALSYLGTEPMFSDEQMKTLAGMSDPGHALRGVLVDEHMPLARRYAAVEAAVQGKWVTWTANEVDARVVASVLARGLAADQMHNRWGLPGQFVGETGQILMSLRAGVREALSPLLSDRRPLEIFGSQAATLQRANRYRICDLAGYLLSQYEHSAWHDSPEPSVRDEQNASLRR